MAACGQCGGPNQTAGTPTHLVFTGHVKGTATNTKVECHLFNDKQQFNALVTGMLSGQALALNVQIYSGYRGAATYKVGTLLDGSGNLRLQAGAVFGDSLPNAGSLTIDSGEKSGSVDADIAGAAIHVKGTFSCDKVKRE